MARVEEPLPGAARAPAEIRCPSLDVLSSLCITRANALNPSTPVEMLRTLYTWLASACSASAVLAGPRFHFCCYSADVAELGRKSTLRTECRWLCYRSGMIPFVLAMLTLSGPLVSMPEPCATGKRCCAGRSLVCARGRSTGPEIESVRQSRVDAWLMRRKLPYLGQLYTHSLLG